MSLEEKNLVVIDDEKYVCNIIMEALSEFPDYKINKFTDPLKAIDFISDNRVDLVLTDLVMGDHSGVQILETAKKYHSDAVVILMTGYPTVKTALSVMQKGGYDYLIKPFKLEDLKSTITRGLEHQRVMRENVRLRSQLELMKISDAVARGMKLYPLLNMICEAAVNEVSAEGASIILLDRKANKYRLRCSAGFSLDDTVREFLTGEGEHGIARLDKAVPFSLSKFIEIDSIRHCRTFLSYPLISKGQNIGFLNIVCLRRFKKISMGQEHLISLIASTTAAAVESNFMDKNLQKSYLLTIKALANAIEARDQYTGGHTDRVYRLAKILARRLGWDNQRIADLRTGSILHDIGKIGVPDAILNKPGRLTPEEFKIMQTHPVKGRDILQGIPFLASIIPYVIAHHEKYDGSGYPFGLKGEDIPFEGRLLAVVDTFDAILSDRPYRPSAGPQKALQELIDYKGKQFDPHIVDTFIEAYNDGKIDVEAIYGKTTEAVLAK